MNLPLLFRHGWLLFVAVNVLNAFVLKFRSRYFIRERPELAGGYGRMFRGILFWGSLPWLVMGIGIEFGGVRGIFSYFHPRAGDPYVLAWFATIVGLWILGFHWLFFQRGAEFLIEHPGLLRGAPKSSAMIRFFYCVMLVGGVIGMLMMFVVNIPELPQ